MSGPTNWLQWLDETVTHTMAEWNIYTTFLAIIIVSILAYTISTSRDSDAHPMLLARQAQGSPVRNPGESAIYRSHGAPHGMSLTTGLNIKDPGVSKWARGRDGDLRDVWRKAVTGPADDEGKSTGNPAHLFTVLGSDNVIQHDLGRSSYLSHF